jgi:hypothetical protein
MNRTPFLYFSGNAWHGPMVVLLMPGLCHDATCTSLLSGWFCTNWEYTPDLLVFRSVYTLGCQKGPMFFRFKGLGGTSSQLSQSALLTKSCGLGLSVPLLSVWPQFVSKFFFPFDLSYSNETEWHTLVPAFPLSQFQQCHCGGAVTLHSLQLLLPFISFP